jgi:hypothetical protein
VDGAAAELSEILFSAAKSSLKRCKVYKKDSPKNKKWFDKDLKKIWSITCVVAKHIPKDPTIEDPNLVTYT